MRTLGSDDLPNEGEPFKSAHNGKVYVLARSGEPPVCGGCVGREESICEQLPKCTGQADDAYGFIFEAIENVKIKVCTTCGSPRVFQDAYVNLNDPDDVRTFDDIVCDDCGKECSTKEVEVDADFDLDTDFYKEEA